MEVVKMYEIEKSGMTFQFTANQQWTSDGDFVVIANCNGLEYAIHYDAPEMDEDQKEAYEGMEQELIDWEEPTLITRIDDGHVVFDKDSGREAIGILNNPDGADPMMIYCNGKGEPMTAENEEKVEEIGYSADGIDDARTAAMQMYGAWPWDYDEF